METSSRAPVHTAAPGLLRVHRGGEVTIGGGGIELRCWHLTRASWGNDAEGGMDTKPKDTKTEDLDLELAVFSAP